MWAKASAIKMRKLAAVLACRNNSARLYGKPLQNLDTRKGISILDQLISLLKTVPPINEIVLAISEGPHNTAFIDYAKKNHFVYIIGDEENMLVRLILGAEKVNATDIFRVTTECPFIMFEKIQEAWKLHIKENNDATFLDNVVVGANFEIVTLAAMKKSHEKGNERHRSEYSTLYIREHSQDFKIKQLEVPQEYMRNDIRLTGDTPEDLIVLRAIYKEFSNLAPKIPLKKIIAFMDRNPGLLKLIAPLCKKSIITCL